MWVLIRNKCVVSVGLKAEEKLINLGSRNFFLCSKPSSAVKCGCSKQPKVN
uniref:Uncharacterized protein n=1 Tax=Manihot esculenta TaxID=3983 RepID=A0A199UAC5_MANES